MISPLIMNTKRSTHIVTMARAIIIIHSKAIGLVFSNSGITVRRPGFRAYSICNYKINETEKKQLTFAWCHRHLWELKATEDLWWPGLRGGKCFLQNEINCFQFLLFSRRFSTFIQKQVLLDYSLQESVTALKTIIRFTN